MSGEACDLVGPVEAPALYHQKAVAFQHERDVAVAARERMHVCARRSEFCLGYLKIDLDLWLDEEAYV